ncbi:MAG: NAD(P)H-dependent glycerol-3-phosphate dehydrogenase [Gammaproteobacteria bacterium]
MSKSSPIGVIGAGSWGTALAVQLAKQGNPTLLWGRNAEHLETLSSARENVEYLPGVTFPDTLSIETNLKRLCMQCDDLLVVTPSYTLHEIVTQLGENPSSKRRIALATKGLEQGSGRLPHDVIGDLLGRELPVVILSGPTFAAEVGRGMPTAITIAGEQGWAADLAERLHSPSFRPYLSNDLVGVEIGGAVKNVIAIGAGISDGLGFGANARVALITRGLAEMMRLGVKLGGKTETFMGLAGIGDLVLTCTDDQSRNRRMGLKLGAGTTLDDAHLEIVQVVEGVVAAREIFQLAQKLGIEMPIIEQVFRVIYEGRDPREAVNALLSREIKSE